MKSSISRCMCAYFMKFGYRHLLCVVSITLSSWVWRVGGAEIKLVTIRKLYHGYPLLSRFEPDKHCHWIFLEWNGWQHLNNVISSLQSLLPNYVPLLKIWNTNHCLQHCVSLSHPSCMDGLSVQAGTPNASAPDGSLHQPPAAVNSMIQLVPFKIRWKYKERFWAWATGLFPAAAWSTSVR